MKRGMKPGLTISCIGHAGVMLWGLAAFAAKPMDAPQPDPLPVEFISAQQFSQLTAGVKNAPKPIDNPKPFVEKIADAKPVKLLAPKVVDKQPDITTDSATPPEPKPKPKPKVVAKNEPKPKPEIKPPPKPEPKPETKSEAKTEEKPKPAQKPDKIAQELKKEEAKKRPKPRKKPPQFRPDQIAKELEKDERKKTREAPRFDANQVAALLDQREPQRQLATGATLNGNVALGTAAGHAAVLSQSELDALRAKLISLWNPPAAVSTNPDQYVVTIHIRLTRDHRLIGPPEVLTSGQGPLFDATRDSAVRAVIEAQPYDMLSQATYDLWKDITLTFNPREVFGG